MNHPDGDAHDRGIALLARAAAYYAGMERFRRDRDRNKRYCYGDQWSDIVEVDGRRITEEQYIKEQGSIPLKNNLIRRLVRSVVGVYNSRSTEPVCVTRDSTERATGETMTTLLKYNMQVNRMSALYTRSIEEFLISGMVVHRKSYGTRNGRTDCWTDYVQPNNFFVDNRMRDFRGWDCSLVGEIHDIPFDTLCSRFAASDDDCERLRALYRASSYADVSAGYEAFGMPAPPRGFACPADASLCRVVEVWQKESRVSRSPRWHVDEVWRYYFITPAGEILAEGDSPYAHGSHPYVMKAYPLIDGEIHSFVADVIDQQRYTNRLVTLYDWIMRASAKGVLLVPEDCIPRGCSPADFADTWSRYNGVLYYRPSVNGNVPQQISANSTNIGIKDLLDLQLGFFENISGVNDALQGKTSNVAMSAELFGQQTQNATTTLLDLLDTFNEFVRDAAYKDVSNIRQYYSHECVRQIAGADADLHALDVEYDLSITPGTSTPAYRQSYNAVLMEIWKSGQISLEQMLRCSTLPFADSLLQML